MSSGRSGSGTTFLKFISDKNQCPFTIKVRTPCGRSAPLHELLFCDHEKCLSVVHPIAALRNIENYFCLHCVRTWAPNFIRRNTRCPKCISCPACFATCEKILMMPARSYLLQCTFCWWLSKSVGIKAQTATDLIQMIAQSDKDEVSKLQLELNELVKLYGKNIQEKLPFLGSTQYSTKSRWYKSNMLDGSSQKVLQDMKDSGILKRNRNANWWKKKMPGMQTQMQDSSADQHIPGTDPLKRQIACSKPDRKLEKKRKKWHELPKKEFENAWVKPADPRFVTDIKLERVSSLDNRLADPIRQPVLLEQLQPQRVRLMTKESFKCPDTKCNHALLVKPQSGTRSAHFEVKKLAIDYLPHMRMEGPFDGWPAKDADNQTVKFYIYFANPLNTPITIQINPRANESYSNAEVTCSGRMIVISMRDCGKMRTIWPPRLPRRKPDEYNTMNMLAFPLTVIPRDPNCKRLEFVLDINLTCQILTSESESTNACLRYPLEITVKRTERRSTSAREPARSRARIDSDRRVKPRQRTQRHGQSNIPASMPTRKPGRKTYNY